MCEFVGYIGNGNAVDKVANSLACLERKGYDSFGLAVPQGAGISIIRTVGKIDNMQNSIKDKGFDAPIAIGHARWATHGRPSEVNAHPYRSDHIVLVHNGIIENYREIKDKLTAGGYQFQSDTDTEALTHFVHSLYKGDLLEAVRRTFRQVRGTYSLAAISSNEPDKMVLMQKGSPLAIGVVDEAEGYIITSSIPAALDVTHNFIFLNEGDSAALTGKNFAIYDSNGKSIRRDTEHIDWDVPQAEKNGYEDFMLKEIYEQPITLLNTLRGRVIVDEGQITLDELHKLEGNAGKIERIILIACGTSWHASLLGKLFIERYAKIPVEVDIASEFVNRDLPLNPNVLCVFTSQSGETADTKAALKAAQKRKATTIAICNVVGSSIANEADYAIYTHAGQEISIASTKVFTAQTLVMLLLALWLGERRKSINNKQIAEILADLMRLPRRMQILLDSKDEIKVAANIYKDAQHFMFLGRNITTPIALEGALKLKETSYINAVAYPAGELRHGPIATLYENFPVMVFAPTIQAQEQLFVSLREAKAQGAKVIAIFSEYDKKKHPECEHAFYLPNCVFEEMTAFLSVIVAQLFAYYCAQGLGRDVDKPRNLTKSVTE